MSEGAGQPPRAARRLFIDLTPLRRSRDLRRLVSGELVSVLGNQLTAVAVPYQVYQLTRSSLAVGLVSDGLFHAGGFIVMVAGLFLLADARHLTAAWAMHRGCGYS